MTLWLPPPLPLKETAPHASSQVPLHLAPLLHVMLIKLGYLHVILTPWLTKAHRRAFQPGTKGLTRIAVRSPGGDPLGSRPLFLPSSSLLHRHMNLITSQSPRKPQTFFYSWLSEPQGRGGASLRKSAPAAIGFSSMMADSWCLIICRFNKTFRKNKLS